LLYNVNTIVADICCDISVYSWNVWH